MGCLCGGYGVARGQRVVGHGGGEQEAATAVLIVVVSLDLKQKWCRTMDRQAVCFGHVS